MKLCIERVSKSYGSNKALKEFSASFEPGIYAFLGPNGAGKSTLMNIITDNLKADGGQITFDAGDGKEENARRMGLRFRKRLGYMPQYPGLYPDFTVERFLWYMAALKGMSKGQAKEQIPEILKAVELDDVPRRRIGALSGGMKQRLGLAQAVLGDPDILILDEPTAGLDPKQRIAIRNFISKISFNKIVLIATHVVSDIEFIAKDVIILKKGVVEDNAPPAQLLRKIEGKVWFLPCEEQEVQNRQKQFRVTNIGREEESGKALLRILSEEKPDGTVRTAPPTLEDYYLYIFGDVESRK